MELTIYIYNLKI